MKRICAFWIASILCLSVITISYAAAPSFAATKWRAPPTGFGGGSRVIPTDTIVSYSNLRDYRTAVNKWLSEGQYSGFHGTASLTYTGSFYFIQLVQDGNVYWLCNGSGGRYRTEVESSTDDSATTTVPSTTAPSIDKTESTETDHTYISDPSTPSNSLSELDALNRLIRFTVTQIKSIQGVWRTNINMYNIQIKMRSLMWNMIDGINNVTDGVYEQVDLLTGYLPRLDDIYNRLFNIQSASWASVDVENRIYSSVTGLGSRLDTLVTNSTGTNSRLDKLITNGTGLATRLDTLITNSAGIDSRLDSIINNGAVQVNTSSIDARLDKLISMYSKVNSVVLDTAAINGGQIKAAVGGELEDVMFWGQSNYASDISFGFADPLTYTLNDVQEPVIDRPLRGMVLGTAIPSCISGMDDVLQAGIWRRPDGKYVISDTYNASTGEYVQRVRSTAYDGTEKWKMVAKTDGVNMFYLTDKAFKSVNANHFCQSSLKKFSHADYVSNFNTSANAAAKYKNKFTVRYATIGFIVDATEYPDLDTWKTKLSDMTSRGCPLTIWFVPSIDPELGLDYSDGPTVSMLDRTVITVPEGNSTISSARVRITGKYETYDSYTQTADIIAAINNIPPYDDTAVVDAIANLENALSKPSATVTADLTEVTARLDTLIENSASKIENTTVNITEDNDAFNVFYITGEDGETQPVTEFAKDLSGASGKFLSVLYRLVFSDALNSADSDLGSLEDFFTSTEPEEDTATQSVDSAHEEVDVWSAF